MNELLLMDMSDMKVRFILYDEPGDSEIKEL
jgi:hypothetical protein